jgi:D-glutamate N-acetyltransferase
MPRRIIILTEGHTEPHAGKTAASVIRYRGHEVVALLDGTQAGRNSGELLGTGNVPIVGKLDDVPEANTLLLGIAPPGGKIPPNWRAIILDAIARRKMDVISGLHDFVGDDPQFAAAAKASGVTIYDVRKNTEKTIARRQGLRPDCLRVHAVGHDCSIGKMVVSIEVTNGLKRRGHDAKFIATGQTGIMVEGDGLPIDCVVADFVSGAAEKLVLENQHHDILLVEGQGSLVHPSYSGVTLSLLHGCAPQALILCYECGRDRVTGVESVPIPPLAEIKRIYDVMSNIHQKCKIIGIGINSRKLSTAEAARERERTKAEFGLPACDVFRDGPDELVEAVIRFKNAGGWHSP